MFETMQVAKKIKELRIKKNMTQMNLADAIGVSFQAVSNWERGNAMPDISKLGELADIFGCSIDDLLGESRETKVIKKIINAEIEGEIPDINIHEMGEIAPLLKPEQTESILEGIIRDQKHLHLKDVILLAPFLSEEMLDQLVENADMEGEFGDIVGLAPYLSDESLTKLARDIVEKEEINMNEIISLAPYLQEEFLEELVDKLTDKGSDKKVAGLFPYLSSAGSKKIAEKFMKRGDFKSLASLAPYLD